MSTRRVLKYGMGDDGNHFELYEESFVDEDKVTLEVKDCYFETVAADASRNVNIPRQSRGLYDVSRSKRLERGR